MNILPYVLERRPKLTKNINEVGEVQGFGAQILKLCNGRRSAKEIIDAFSKKYPKGDVNIIANFTMHLLCEFENKGIVEF